MYVLQFDPFELDLRCFELRCGGERCPLEPQVFEVLTYLVTHRDRLVTKDELMDHVWGHRYVTENTLNSRIMAARKALGDTGREQRFIRTVRGRGFHFAAVVTEATTALAEGAAPATAAAPLPHTAPGTSALLGRERELELLRAHLGKTLQGTRQIVLLTGEAGLGKTTLVRSFLAALPADQAALTASGQCLEHRGTGEPYLPLLDAVSHLCRGPHAAGILPALLERAPTWMLQIPWLVPTEALPELERRGARATRERMLREMGEALEALSAERLVVLALEDLQWSDPSTLDLLDWIARRMEPARLLILGTCRTEEARRPDAALYRMLQPLRVRGLCAELVLSHLDEAAVQSHLEQRASRLPLSPELSQVLHRRTGGNPLYLEALLRSWDERGLWEVREEDAYRAWSGDLPLSLRELLEEQLQRNSPEDLELLEAASLIGPAFDSDMLASGLQVTEAEVEQRCRLLSRRSPLLSAAEGVDLTPDSGHTRYAFQHHLYVQVLSERLDTTRRRTLHQRYAEHLEGRAGDRTAELAFHFERGGEAARAVAYLRKAAEGAHRRAAHREAAGHLSRALALLDQLPAGLERDQVELSLQCALAPALVASRGWGAPEAETAFRRARELSEFLPDPPYRSTALIGLATLLEFRGQYAASEALLEECFRLRPDPLSRLISLELLACSSFHQGHFQRALEQADHALALMATGELVDPVGVLGEHLEAACHAWAAQALWFLGYPDQSLERVGASVHAAERSGNRFSIALCTMVAACIHRFRGELPEARELANRAREAADREGFPYLSGVTRILDGWSGAALGETDAGAAAIRVGLTACRETGAIIDDPYYLALLSEVALWKGAPREALAILQEAGSQPAAGRAFFYRPELSRLTGEALLQLDRAGEAASCFRQAVEEARSSGARSLELRASLSLARLLAEQGDRESARSTLRPGLASLREGLRTTDVLRAQALLAEIEG